MDLSMSSLQNHFETKINRAWRRHEMETFSASLALCEGKLPVTGYVSWCFSHFRPKELFSKHSNGRWSGTPWRSCDISGMEFCIIYQDLLHSFVPLQWRHNERGGLLNHRCLDCLLNRLFRHSSWIFLIFEQLQNYVHECLIEDNSSLFKLMAWQWTDAKPLNNTISHTQICHWASQCATMIKTPYATRTTEVIHNCLRADSLLLQSRWQCLYMAISIAVAVMVCRCFFH